MKHVVMFSGGVTSWAAAKRVAERHGLDDLVLLFTDTLTEDADTYRWLTDAAANVGAPLVRIDQGMTIWDVFRREHSLGSQRFDLCSRQLKRRPAQRWVKANCDPADTVLYLGYDWNELHRVARSQAAWAPWRVEAPMAETPFLTKPQMLMWAEREGITPQRLYQLGFPHANCGGGCVKAGMGHFLHLLEVWPERFAEWEQNEEAIRQYLGKNVSMLADRAGGGPRRPLTLRALRERQQAKPEQGVLFEDDWGGCGCFTEEAPEP